MAEALEDLTERLLDAAQAPPGRKRRTRSRSPARACRSRCAAGRCEQAERAEGVEIGLRVLIGRRQACVVGERRPRRRRSRRWPSAPSRWRARRRRIPGAAWRSRTSSPAAGSRRRSIWSTPRRCRRRGRCRRRRWRPRRRRWRCPGVSKIDARRRGLAVEPHPSRGQQRLRRRLRAAPSHAMQAVAICRRGPRHGARLRLREPRPLRADLPDARDGRPAGRRARRGARRRRQAADRRVPGALRRARRRQPDRPPRAGGERPRDRPRRQLAEGRAGRAGAARRAST